MDAMVSDHKEDIKKFQRVADKGKRCRAKTIRQSDVADLERTSAARREHGPAGQIW